MTSTSVSPKEILPVDMEKSKQESVNLTHILPVDYKVLIKPDDITDTDDVYRAAKEAGLELDLNTSEREQMAQVEGLLVAVGGNAFSDWKGMRPEPGMRVMIARHAGLLCEARNGDEYRLCNDKDVAAVLR